MEFEKRKAATLASMSSPEPDKSPKGTLDAPIIPLLNAINSHPSYFTTSSCSGRISILSQPAAAAAPKKKARGGTWLFITHNQADPDSVLNLLFPTTEPIQTRPFNPVFRFEPLIIAVECKDVPSAQTLVSLAISCGFRESGITSVSKRVIIAIRCSIRLEVPLGDSERILVPPEYVRFLVGIANEKMEANRRRTDSFLKALMSYGSFGPQVAESGELVLGNGVTDDSEGSVKVEESSSECQLNLSKNDQDIDVDSKGRVHTDTRLGN